ncbi:MAG: 50S ribosome-binding GTPase [Planctomycetaceae bacterium]|nr:50S ribosome-binding GTPase [Planctomycetaceae bacterium]
MSFTASTDAPLLAAVLTPSGRAAVATIGLGGQLDLLDAAFHPRNRCSAAAQIPNHIAFGLWSLLGPGAADTEEVVYCRIAEHQAELHCHGGAAAVSRILADLTSCGCRVVSSGEFAALVTDPVLADVDLTLSQAATARTAQLLLQQRTLFPAAVSDLKNLPPDERGQRIGEMLSWWWFGRHQTAPWQVVLCGEPNVGKSTLMNALVGYERAIVFDQPGTTRDVLTAETALAGWPIQFLDTAGLRETDEHLEAEGIQKARQRVHAADLVIIMHDATVPQRSVQLAREIEKLNTRVLQVWNKIDQCPEAFTPPTGHVQISALRNLGLEELQRAIVARLVPRQPPEDLPIPCSAWQQALLLRLSGHRDA